jgi:DNA-binding CsgD family transcriptional regulator/PAS domain-containing protein
MADGQMVRAADVGLLLGAVGELYACDDVQNFPRVTVRAARRLIEADVVGYNEVDPLVERCPYWIEPHVEAAGKHAAALEAHLTEHPRMVDFMATEEPVARATSDYLSVGEWESTAIFNEFYRHWDSNDQLILLAGLATRPGWSVGIVYSRQRRGFSDRDRAVLDLLRPHVLAAYRNSEAVAGLRGQMASILAGADMSNAAVIVVDREGRVQAATRAAHTVLCSHFPSWTRRPGSRLPTGLAAWAMPHIEPPTDVPPPVLAPFVLRTNDVVLTARLVNGGGMGEASAIVLDERPAPSAASATSPRARAAALPPRLRQVLDRLLAGDSEKQIATRIGLSPHTVHDHVKRLYRTLDVNARSELLALFVEK